MKSKEELYSLLEVAANNYYNNSVSPLSDEEYDLLKEYTGKPEILNDGANIKLQDSIKHTTPMLSLEKAKTHDEIVKFVNRVREKTNSNFVVSPKLDGLALSVIYDAATRKVKTLATRGTGVEGEDITYILYESNIDIKGLLRQNPTNYDIEVRGELFITPTDLTLINKNRGEDFKNERIAIASIIKKSKLGLDYKAPLSFRAYSAHFNGEEIELPKDQPSAIDLFPYNKSSTVEELSEIISQADDWRKTCGAPTDGVVISLDEIVDLGSTSHHPLNKIAYKYPSEEKVSKVIDVIWQPGKTGRFTPVAIIEPVIIDQVEINRITLNNIDWINENNIKINSIVSVTRANDVIPQIKRVITNGEDVENIEPPKICSLCNANVVKHGAYNICQNEDCIGKIKSKIYNYCSRGLLNIEGLGKETLDSLSLNTIVDVLNLKQKELADSNFSSNVKVGDSRATAILKEIEKAKNNTPYHIWLVTLGFDSLGKLTAEKLIRHFKSIDSILNASKEELKQVESIGEMVAESIVSKQSNARNIWAELKDIITINIKSEGSKGSFAITGKVPQGFKNRNEYVKHLESLGYSFHSSIRKDTKFLITDNPEANSSKLKKARGLGIAIVKELN